MPLLIYLIIVECLYKIMNSGGVQAGWGKNLNGDIMVLLLSHTLVLSFHTSVHVSDRVVGF